MPDRSIVIAGPGTHFATEIATTFARQGFDIALMGRNEDRLTAIASRLGELGVSSDLLIADFTDQESVDNAVKQANATMPPWACAVYNVKQSTRGGLFSVASEDMLSDLDANTIGALRLTRSLVSSWDRTADASIILSGGDYKDKPHAEKLGLSLSKGALHTLGIALQSELNPLDIYVAELIVHGEVRKDGRLSPEGVAQAYWATYDTNSIGPLGIVG